jgi:hypothetical protein
MPKGTATCTDLLAKIFTDVALPWDAVTTLDIHLHTGLGPGIGGTSLINEANYVPYVPVSVARTTSGWTVVGAGVDNDNLIQFAQCVSGTNTLTFVSITPGGSTQLLYLGSLNSPLTVSALIQPQFAAGALDVTEA